MKAWETWTDHGHLQTGESGLNIAHLLFFLPPIGTMIDNRYQHI